MTSPIIDSAESQFQRVSTLIMKHLSSKRADDEILKQLETIARGEHDSSCALGAVPACTCGVTEAQEYTDLTLIQYLYDTLG